MNFLSHFYFDRHTINSNRVLGTVLPDLLKNANKTWNLQPKKVKDQLIEDPGLNQILDGWTRHLEVDKFFHSSEFFLVHTRNLRLLIAPVIEESPVRPSFLAHIALELMLDGLLLTETIIRTEDFYAHLIQASRKDINTFLEVNNAFYADTFQKFLDEFIHVSYLDSYQDTHQIIYALNRICMRLWNDPLNEKQKLQITAILLDYRQELKKVFMDIFDEIDLKLNPKSFI